MDDTCQMSGSTSVRGSTRSLQGQQSFEVEFGPDPSSFCILPLDSAAVKRVQLGSPSEEELPAILNEEDRLSRLPPDMLCEILKRVQCSDAQCLRGVSRFWRSSFSEFVHVLRRPAQKEQRKALWICTTHDSGNIAVVSNYTCSRKKLYGKILRFPENHIIPENMKMVASEAGLICFRVETCALETSPVSSSSSSSKGHAFSALFVRKSSKVQLLVCNPILMMCKTLPPLTHGTSKMYTNFGLIVDDTTMSFKVVVARSGQRVQVFDSKSGSWTAGSAPPRDSVFAGSRNAVTYDGCTYFVAYAQNDFCGRLPGKMWFILRYDVKTDTWKRMGDISRVHHLNSMRICHHVMLPDLVASSEGVVLVAENDTHTNKHIFQLNQATCQWKFVFHVPMSTDLLTKFGRVKCFGIQDKLFFQPPNSIPIMEVDLVTRSWAWCLPVGLYTKRDFKAFAKVLDVKDVLAFEPSLFPVSGSNHS
ncbi:hypothetical protein MPTK1_8g12540 [Marchantia polymorpha subsp. ruderalis]|uniref:F-box domain-containing protein n=1 Tax=Marchantia polymorpha TaxID=3197 RepID=A0A2R6WJR8_MARPO|nr:hypothetical protein MARPO_0083s0066 [Marchantia polymorpha]BBN19661.1 hypothetical protein Mp_8g12540 [Marchantia polymorpha subsp. ruderalis]|eukprot:PTQ34106.1 hypothetical protein MARPO_0083s0066 [Marchantia polymorpha]